MHVVPFLNVQYYWFHTSDNIIIVKYQLDPKTSFIGEQTEGKSGVYKSYSVQ